MIYISFQLICQKYKVSFLCIKLSNMKNFFIFNQGTIFIILCNISFENSRYTLNIFISMSLYVRICLEDLFSPICLSIIGTFYFLESLWAIDSSKTLKFMFWNGVKRTAIYVCTQTTK